VTQVLLTALIFEVFVSKMAEKLPNENGKTKSPEQSPLIFTEKMLEQDFDDVYRNYPLSDDTTCGFGIFRGKYMQM
jgi:hypothetical protein